MLMKVPKRPKDKAATAGNDVEDLRRELAAADAERADAVRIRHDLEEQRSEVVDVGDLEALEEHDRAIENARRRIDVADSAHARLTLALQAVEAEAEQARRRALRAQAEKAMAEAATLMRTDYVRHAKAVAATLRQVAALRAIALAANETLPDGDEPVATNVEPLNARHWASGSDETTELRLFHRVTGELAHPSIVSGPDYEHRLVTARRPVPFYPEVPHRAVADFVNLPGVDPDEYIYAASHWTQPRA